MTTRRFEVWTTGIDESLAGIGGDAWGSSTSVGLRIPSLATQSPTGRYLFLLCGFEVPAGAKANILGWRELLTIGAVVPGASGQVSVLVEQEVLSPAFRFPDGNVSYHLTRIPPSYPQSYVLGPPPSAASKVDGIAWRASKRPSLLFESVTLSSDGLYTTLTSYVPPNQGRPYGQPIANLGTMHEVRTRWSTHGAWRAFAGGLCVREPGFCALWASVRQTAGITWQPTIAFPEGLASEYQFIANYGSSVKFWRVGGALDVEME